MTFLSNEPDSVVCLWQIERHSFYDSFDLNQITNLLTANLRYLLYFLFLFALAINILLILHSCLYIYSYLFQKTAIRSVSLLTLFKRRLLSPSFCCYNSDSSVMPCWSVLLLQLLLITLDCIHWSFGFTAAAVTFEALMSYLFLYL